ncbi:MAG: CpaF family protein [Lachnospiraceae bacterium]|nr:CpaF family protein [Lachnospiraceae bacterium]
MKTLKDQIYRMVVERLDMSRELSDDEVEAVIDNCILSVTDEGYLSLKEKLRLRRDIFNSLRRMDILTQYMEDDSVSEIMVNGYSNIFIEKNGKLFRSDKCFESEEKLMSVIQQIVAGCNRRVNESTPIVDARLPDGSRVHVVTRPVALSGPTITIRRFPNQAFHMEHLVTLGTLSAAVADILRLLVVAGYNIFICGGTGSGKTTFLNELSEFIPADSRIVTIEDAAELQIRGIDNLVRLEARPENIEGDHAISIRDLIKASLRMRPDRIIVGEVRDGAAIDMLTAMNTGHDGSLSTGHANSCEDMISRLCTMVLMGMDLPMLAVKQQISSAVDIIIHVSRMRDRTRKVTKICEVLADKNGEPLLRTLYEFREEETSKKTEGVKGTLEFVQELCRREKLKDAGLMEVYDEAEQKAAGSASAGKLVRNGDI